jgi:hypothetical protein
MYVIYRRKYVVVQMMYIEILWSYMVSAPLEYETWSSECMCIVCVCICEFLPGTSLVS